MKKQFVILSLLAAWSTTCPAAEPIHLPEAIEVKVNIGTPDGAHVLNPSQFTFERGKYYKLIIHNPSPEEHYFTSDAFATHIFTRKVEVLNEKGDVIAEVHGAVNDLELDSGATVAWYFYPMTKGENLQIYCHKEGHEDKGLSGTISIVGPPPFSR